tara:strand:+ start:679 stop:1266 length:588 start_codon:yes stop_codon:yes gene_type:complete
MIKQTVFITNFSSLYEILDENKENLSFNIIEHQSIEKLIIDKNFDLKNSLIITKPNNKLNFNKNLENMNILNFHNYPILLNKLIELINIQLIKIKFNHQSRIAVKNYEIDLNSKTLTKNHLILKLTEKEVEIILHLNKNKNKHNVLELQKDIWGYSADIETHTVETHVYRLRKKISNKFNDEDFILSYPEGYSLG